MTDRIPSADIPGKTDGLPKAAKRPAILDLPPAATETDSARRAARRMLQRADEEEL